MIKSAARQLLQRLCIACGYELVKRNLIPHGHDWKRDVRWAAGTEPVKCALDIGANVGQTARDIVETFPGAQVECFEPIAETFASLLTSTAEMANVRCHRLAFAEEPGNLFMSAVPGAGTNRLVNELQVDGPVESVPVSTVDAFCDHNGIRQIDLLKLDVEGAELRVLKGALQSLESRGVRFVLSECDFHPREDQPHANFVELEAFLRGKGFRVHSFYTAGVDGEGWRWGNVLFIRPFFLQDGFSRSPHGSLIRG